MNEIAERAMRDAMKIAEAARKLDEADELITEARNRVHDLAVTVCALANLATQKGDHQLHSDISYYVAQINKVSWNMPELNSQKWDAEQDAKDQRERIAMLDRWIEKQEAAVKRWRKEARDQRARNRECITPVSPRGCGPNHCRAIGHIAHKEIEMKKGDKVMIYEDPITQKHEEGMATLVRQLSKPGSVYGLSHWDVRFDTDVNETFCRSIQMKPHEKAKVV